MNMHLSPVGCAWSADAASDTLYHRADMRRPSCPLYCPENSERLI